MPHPSEESADNRVSIGEVRALGHSLAYLATRLDQIAAIMEKNQIAMLPRMGKTTAPRGQELLSSFVSRLQKRLDDILSSPPIEPPEVTPEEVQRLYEVLVEEFSKVIDDPAVAKKSAEIARDKYKGQAEGRLEGGVVKFDEPRPEGVDLLSEETLDENPRRQPRKRKSKSNDSKK